MTPESNGMTLGMEDNLKKAVTEMLILRLLSREDMHAAQIMDCMERESGGTLSIAFPYACLYRLEARNYIIEAYKKVAPDGRRRQYFQITPDGREYAQKLHKVYLRIIGGVNALMEEEGTQ